MRAIPGAHAWYKTDYVSAHNDHEFIVVVSLPWIRCQKCGQRNVASNPPVLEAAQRVFAQAVEAKFGPPRRRAQVEPRPTPPSPPPPAAVDYSYLNNRSIRPGVLAPYPERKPGEYHETTEIERRNMWLHDIRRVAGVDPYCGCAPRDEYDHTDGVWRSRHCGHHSTSW